MAEAVQFLTPAITNVLTAPGVDMSRISAKSVRKSMMASDSSIDPAWVASNKQAIDELIGNIFSLISPKEVDDTPGLETNGTTSGHPEAASSSTSHAPPPPKRKREAHSPEGEPLPPSQMPISHAPSRSKQPKLPQQKQALSDAELARQLSDELNNPGRRATRGSSATDAPSRKKGKGAAAAGSSQKKRVTKSKAKIEDDSEDGGSDGGEGEGAPPKKKAKKKRDSGTEDGAGGKAKGGFAKEFLLSDALAAVTGVPALSRPQVSKYLWIYIKANQLQDPKDRREILCDDKMRAVFNSDKVNMFKMNKAIGAHLYEPDNLN